MDAHCSPERLETRKHVHPTAETRHRSHTAHASRNRGAHTHPRKHRITSMRRSLCNGGGGADKGTAGDVTIALACTQATAQM